jgi:hypothetical protein
VEIVDTPPDPIGLTGRSLGNATFIADKERTAILQYPADGEEKSISVKAISMPNLETVRLLQP